MAILVGMKERKGGEAKKKKEEDEEGEGEDRESETEAAPGPVRAPSDRSPP